MHCVTKSSWMANAYGMVTVARCGPAAPSTSAAASGRRLKRAMWGTAGKISGSSRFDPAVNCKVWEASADPARNDTIALLACCRAVV